MESIRGVRGTLRALSAAVVVCLGASGCILLEARKDQAELARFGRIGGAVSADYETSAPMVVVLFPGSMMQARKVEDLVVVDHFVRIGPGRYGFRVEPGEYVMVAFVDLNADGNYDPDEPLLNSREIEPISLASGATVVRDLEIPGDGRPVQELTEAVDVGALQSRSMGEQNARSLGAFLVRGEVADLSDEKFGSANGQLGLARPLDFVLTVGAGIYLTEPYDPDRIPVLFVHGISGYPQEFTKLIESIDKDRFQAWFYFYPSGYRLDNVARVGAELMLQLRLKHGFDRFVVVAHSMGGLVSRSFLFHYLEVGEEDDVPLFVTISTPWGGDDRANMGVKDSPVVLEVWRDMASNSEFLKDLFWQEDDPDEPRELPKDISWHMMFSFRGESRGDQATDGVVTVASELRPEAQEQVETLLGLDYSHTGILRSDEAKQRVNALLDEYVD